MFDDPPPAKAEPPPPTVDRAQLDQDARELQRRRRGRAATVIAGDTGPVSPGSVAASALLGA